MLSLGPHSLASVLTLLALPLTLTPKCTQTKVDQSNPCFPKEVFAFRKRGATVQDKITANGRHHFLPRRQRWPPRSGKRAAGQPRVLARDHTSFWVGRRHFPHHPASHSFASSRSLRAAFLKSLQRSEKGSKEWGQPRGVSEPPPPSVIFCFQVPGLSRMSSLVLLFLGPVTPKPPHPQDHCDQNKRTDHSTEAAAAPTVAAAAWVAATAARAGPGPDPDAPRPGG